MNQKWLFFLLHWSQKGSGFSLISSLYLIISESSGNISVMVHKEDPEEALEILDKFKSDQSEKVMLDIIYQETMNKKTQRILSGMR